MNAGTRVHYRDYPDDQGEVVATRVVDKTATGGGTGGQNSGQFIGRVATTQYQVAWDGGAPDWHFKDELVALGR